MKVLADESVEARVIQRLREHGHEVAAIVESNAGASDEEVLRKSSREGRVLVTSDKDFARLAFPEQQGAVGIVPVRMPRASAEEKASRLLAVLDDSTFCLTGAMTVIDHNGIRRRRLPAQP